MTFGDWISDWPALFPAGISRQELCSEHCSCVPGEYHDNVYQYCSDVHVQYMTVHCTVVDLHVPVQCL